ncbi:hypothetical protein GVN18_30110 [Pseudomonas sp. ODNR1LW]|nr:hypothetical protein [Pseudomonas sp. ODNR1LW]
MIRKTLYMAASAVALLTTAQAHAAEIVGRGTFSTVRSSDVDGAYKLAEELTYFTAYSSATAAAATQGSVVFDLVPTAGFTLDESLLLTLDIAGGVFTTSTDTYVDDSDPGSCEVSSVVPVTPVERDATSAQYLVTLADSSTCQANATFGIRLPVQVTGPTMTIGALLQQSFGGTRINVDGGRTEARFVTTAPAFSVDIQPIDSGATALVSTGYRELNGSGINIGSLSVAVDTDVHLDMDGVSATSTAVQNVALTATAVTGSFTGYNIGRNGFAFTSGTSTATVATVRVSDMGSFVGNDTFYLNDNTDTATTSVVDADAVIPASTFTLTAAVDLVDGLRDFSETGSLAPLSRDGTSFVAPWIALGAASANSTIRLANNGSTDTGPIQMTLTSSNGAAAATTETVTIGAGQVVAGALTASGGIPAGGVVSISGAALKTAFGTDAANGDVEISIEAQPQFISGKVRVTQSSGQVFESSLGNLGGAD